MAAFAPVGPAYVVVLLGGLVAVTLGYVLYARSVASRLGDRDPPAAWFGFMQRVQWTGLGFWLAWFPCVELLGAKRLVAPLLTPFGRLPYLMGAIAIDLLPPMAVTIALAALAHPLSKRLRGVAPTRSRTMQSALWGQAAVLVPMLCLGLGAFTAVNGQPRQAVVWVAAALAVAPFLAHLQRRSTRQESHSVTSGELRERVFELAAEAGVKLQQLYVVATDLSKMANAFAVRRDTVIVTDHLLANMSRREVDAVLAHELAHLRARHPMWLLLSMVVVWTCGFVAPGELEFPFRFPLLFAISLIVYSTLSRRFERVADAGAVRLTRDPEAMVSALGRLSQLNLIPFEWGRWNGRFLTHPSTAKRVEAIALDAGLPSGRTTRLLEHGLAEPDRYPMPPIGDDSKVFSTTFKAGAGQGIMWSILAVHALLSAALILLLRPFEPAVGRGLELLGCLAITLVASLLVTDRIVVMSYPELRRRLAQRLARAGRDPEPSATFVGLAPESRPRVYEGFFDWDVGFLFIDSSRLVYWGEEARFSLTREQVVDLRVTSHAPGLIRSRRVELSWRTAYGSGVLSIRPAAIDRLSAVHRAARELHDRLVAWRDNPNGGAIDTGVTATVGPDFPPPALGEVTSLSPKQLVHPGTLPLALALSALVAALACMLMGLPMGADRPGLFDVTAIAFLIHVIHRVPYWLQRETSPARERPKLAKAA